MKKVVLTFWITILFILIVFVGAANIYLGRRSSSLQKAASTQSNGVIPRTTLPDQTKRRYSENVEVVNGAEIGNGSILGVTVIDYIPTGEETADVLFGFSYNGLTYKFWMTTASCRDPLPKLEKGKTYNITGSFFTQVTDRESLAKLIERNGGNTQGKGCQTFINLQPISPDEMSKYFRGGDPTWGGKIKDLRGKFYLGNNAEEI